MKLYKLPTWAHIIILGLAYLISGKIGLMLAIPPGFATAIFPPTGIALAYVFSFGLRTLPGVLLGSFLMNVLATFENGVELGAENLFFVPFLIGLGASFQTFCTFNFTKQLMKKELPLVKFTDILSFLTLAGPIGSLINSTIGVLTLFLFNIINEHVLIYSWLNWWVGDTIGVILVFPIIFSLLSPNQKVWKERQKIIIIPMILSIPLCFAMYWFSSEREFDNIKANFSKVSQTARFSLEREIDSYASKLQAARNLFYSSEEVSRKEFSTFASHMIGNDQGIRAIEYAPIVKRKDIPAFIESLEKEFNQPFQIRYIEKDDGTRDLHYIVNYIYPKQGNEQAFGLDLGSHRTRREAIEYAIALHSPSVTETIQLIQDDKEKNPAFLQFLPVYNVKQNSEEAIGLIIGVFDLNIFLKKAFAGIDYDNFNIDIYDITNKKSELIYTINKEKSHKYNSISSKVVVKFFNRDWRIELRPTLNFISQRSSRFSWLVLALGLSISGILGAFLLAFSGKSQEIQMIVEKRTNELKKSNTKLEEATKIKSDFLANMSHEIRTPMNGIIGVTELLEDQLTTPKQKNDLNTIKQSAKDLLVIINDILDLSKLEAGKIQIKEETFSIKQLSKEVKELYTPLAQQKKLRFNVSIEGDSQDLFFGDKTRIKQILNNLTSNALKFTMQGSIEIKIFVDQIINEDYYNITFSVRDTGIGIDKNLLHKLFAPFEQLSSGVSKKFQGTGLGLSICKNLVDLMGGSIAYRQRLDVAGSIFEFTLPLDVSTDIEQMKEELTNIEPQQEDLSSLHVLIVEDNLVNQKICKRFLDKLNIESEIVENGKLAVEKVQKQFFHAILMDCQMPVMDGFQATREIKTNMKNSPYIIALTANAMKEDRENCYNAGMDDYLAKPINKFELIRALNRALKYNSV